MPVTAAPTEAPGLTVRDLADDGRPVRIDPSPWEGWEVGTGEAGPRPGHPAEGLDGGWRETLFRDPSGRWRVVREHHDGLDGYAGERCPPDTVRDLTAAGAAWVLLVAGHDLPGDLAGVRPDDPGGC